MENFENLKISETQVDSSETSKPQEKDLSRFLPHKIHKLK